MKFLVPVARAKPGGLPADGREPSPQHRLRARAKPGNCMPLGVTRSPAIRQRILEHPELFLKTPAAERGERSLPRQPNCCAIWRWWSRSLNRRPAGG